MRLGISPNYRWMLARNFAGATLLFAGAAKLFDRVTGNLTSLTLDLPPTVQVLQIELEISLGLWLVIGFWPILTRWLALATFAVFAAVSAFNVLTYTEDCGCFGSLGLPPGWVLLLDMALVLVLGFSRPEPDLRPHSLAAIALMILFWGSVGGFVLADTTADNPRLLILDPPSWVGRRLPILRRIDVGDQLSRGDWNVVLHRHDCLTCREALPRFERTARAAIGDPKQPRTALLEIPPFASDKPISAQDYPSCILGHLDASRSWRVATASVVRLRDGVVVEAH